MSRRWLLGCLLAASTTASAEPKTSRPLPPGSVGTNRIAVIVPKDSTAQAGSISNTIVMDRCLGDCNIKTGNNDARNDSSMIPAGPAGTNHVIHEFTNSFGDKGANGHCVGDPGTACTQDAQCSASSGICETADKQWAATVQCMKEVYSPYAVQIVEAPPADGRNYHRAILAGVPADAGLTDGILGIAPLSGDCSPIDNAISFSFSNAHNPTDRVNNLCWTIAQESAHAFGLDHEFSYTNGNRSACNDPMTYRTDCGGEKFFRNDTAKCGEDTARDCHCGGTQNSHLKIQSVFGTGTSIVPAPTSTILFPKTGATIQNGIKVSAKAFSKRGVARVELFINGRLWSTAQGSAFGSMGQPESTYQLDIPARVPDSVMDLVVKAYDDLGLEMDSSTETVTKNHACTDDMSCGLPGMTCSAGKCAWPPATGEIGADCTFNEFCLSNLCAMTADGGVCSEECHPGIKDECDEGFDCEPTSPTSGVCLVHVDDPGCCSVGDSPNAVFIHGGLGLAVLGFVFRRKKARK